MPLTRHQRERQSPRHPPPSRPPPAGCSPGPGPRPNATYAREDPGPPPRDIVAQAPGSRVGQRSARQRCIPRARLAQGPISRLAGYRFPVAGTRLPVTGYRFACSQFVLSSRVGRLRMRARVAGTNQVTGSLRNRASAHRQPATGNRLAVDPEPLAAGLELSSGEPEQPDHQPFGALADGAGQGSAAGHGGLELAL